jgi:hypothetical protein
VEDQAGLRIHDVLAGHVGAEYSPTRIEPRLRAGLVTIYRVEWGLGRSEEFATSQEASTRADEIHAELIEWAPILAGTNDAVLPRVVVVESKSDSSGDA